MPGHEPRLHELLGFLSFVVADRTRLRPRMPQYTEPWKLLGALVTEAGHHSGTPDRPLGDRVLPLAIRYERW
jgi:hypothetical protein